MVEARRKLRAQRLHPDVTTIAPGENPFFANANLANPPTTRRFHSASLLSFKPSLKSWKGLLLPISLPSSDMSAYSTAINVAPSTRSSHSTPVLPLRTQSVLYNARPSKSHRCSLILRVVLTTLMPTSSATPCVPRGLTTISSGGLGPF